MSVDERVLPEHFAVVELHALNCIGCTSGEALLAVHLVVYRCGVPADTFTVFPDYLSVCLVKGDACCAEIEYQHLTHNQRRAGEVPRGQLKARVPIHVFLPDYLASSSLETEKMPHFADCINNVTIDGRCGKGAAFV